ARALRAARADPVYVCETAPRKLARIRRLLAASGTDPRRCLILAPEPAEACSHWVDRLVGLGRLTPPAFDAAAYPWPCPAPPGAPRLEVSAAAQADCDAWLEDKGCTSTSGRSRQDRKSTRLNSSHLVISYAVFCLKKKRKRTLKSF